MASDPWADDDDNDAAPPRIVPSSTESDGLLEGLEDKDVAASDVDCGDLGVDVNGRPADDADPAHEES